MISDCRPLMTPSRPHSGAILVYIGVPTWQHYRRRQTCLWCGGVIELLDVWQRKRYVRTAHGALPALPTSALQKKFITTVEMEHAGKSKEQRISWSEVLRPKQLLHSRYPFQICHTHYQNKVGTQRWWKGEKNLAASRNHSQN